MYASIVDLFVAMNGKDQKSLNVQKVEHNGIYVYDLGHKQAGVKMNGIGPPCKNWRKN